MQLDDNHSIHETDNTEFICVTLDTPGFLSVSTESLENFLGKKPP